MPPKRMPQPSPDERAGLLASIATMLKTAARARAGDPGPVVLRRLNNAEYTFTIRDLTGVSSLDPAKEFPADGAAGDSLQWTKPSRLRTMLAAAYSQGIRMPISGTSIRSPSH